MLAKARFQINILINFSYKILIVLISVYFNLFKIPLSVNII